MCLTKCTFYFFLIEKSCWCTLAISKRSVSSVTRYVSRTEVSQPVPSVTVFLDNSNACWKCQLSAPNTNTVWLWATVFSCLAMYCLAQVSPCAAANQLISSAVRNSEGRCLRIRVICSRSRNANSCSWYDVVMMVKDLQCILNICLCYSFFPRVGLYCGLRME